MCLNHYISHVDLYQIPLRIVMFSFVSPLACRSDGREQTLPRCKILIYFVFISFVLYSNWAGICIFDVSGS